MIGFSSLAAIVALSCPIERASYKLRTAPEYSAVFRDVASGRDWPTKVALGIRSTVTNRTFWWLPGLVGSSGRHYLYSTTDVAVGSWQPPSPDGGVRPLGEMEYTNTDASYRVLDELPQRGGPAPAHFFIAQLGETLWYGNANLNWQRERPPTQFFDLTACLPAS